MHVCGIAGQQDPSVAVGRGLPSHVGEPGEPGRTVDSIIGPVCGDERLAQIAQGGFGRGSGVRFGHQDAYPHPIVHLAQGMNAAGVAADAPFRRLLGQLGLGDQVARRRIPSRELDAGCLTDQAAASIAPDEILRPQRLAVGQRDVDAGVVLRETGDLNAVVDRDPQLADPAGQDALDVVLPQPEHVVVPGREVADERGPGEHRDLVFLSLRDEPIGDSTLIENLDGAREQTACALAGQVLVGAPLDNNDVDLRQRQLARQHQPRRTSSDDYHRMFGHRQTPISATRISCLLFRRLRRRRRSCGTLRALRQVPRCAII